MPRWWKENEKLHCNPLQSESLFGMVFCLVCDCVFFSSFRLSIWNTKISLSCRFFATSGFSCGSGSTFHLLHCVITNTASWAGALPAATDPSQQNFPVAGSDPRRCELGIRPGPSLLRFGEAAKSTLKSELWCILNLVGVQNVNLQKSPKKLCKESS